MNTDKENSDVTREGWYTFGNHFHWVGMQWLWGNGILARSIQDMMTFIAETGAPGNINFDGNAYEKLASEEPAAIETLRAAVADGRVEVVGATFGQPYALFHHGESAVRQLTYGLRSSRRVLGVRPRSFWEEEFYFFPQLPQMLTDTGYEYASLFFQWTWHTPEIPKEVAPAVRWRGIDGSEVLTLPRSELNLHQWPEDVAELIRSGKLDVPEVPVVQQWLELLPSPEWMCRSELVIPGVRNLFDNSGIAFKTGTLSTVLDAVADLADVREYSMDDVFHGMSIGKNGNLHHQTSRRAEHTLLAAEAFSVLSGDLGRPYAHWGKYPAWELEEGWRELLAFQHHDNDECEGLNGHIGYFGVGRGIGLGSHVLDRTLRHLATALVPVGDHVVANPVGWDRRAVVEGRLVELPAFSVSAVAALEGSSTGPVVVQDDGASVVLRRGDFVVEIDREAGVATRVGDAAFPGGLGALEWTRDGEATVFDVDRVVVDDATVRVTRRSHDAEVEVRFALAPEIDALDVSFTGELGEGPDGRFHSSLMTGIETDFEVHSLRHDTPYAVSEIHGRNAWSRKYPTGAWMTSPQEFETVRDVFTGLQFVDALAEDGAGVLWIHDGAQGFTRTGRGLRNVLSMRDPWDEDEFKPRVDLHVRVLPHGPVSDSWRWMRAQEFVRPPMLAEAVAMRKDDMHSLDRDELAVFRIRERVGVAVTAQYRDSDFAATGFEDHVNHAARQPVILRVVELDGAEGRLELEFAQQPLRAHRASMLGEAREELALQGSALTLALRPHEIATVAIEFPPAPGEDKTLDEDRSIWATVHLEAPTDDDADRS